MRPRWLPDMIRLVAIFISSLALAGAETTASQIEQPWVVHGDLSVSKNARYLEHEDGTPFIWLGCTAWGMTELLTREDVAYFLDDRSSKGFNLVPICLFWGKRSDYPIRFRLNPENAYGDKAFIEKNGVVDPYRAAVVLGGSPLEPNDYWDHVEYCLREIEARGMYAAVLPVWGRRYVNATHEGQSSRVFDEGNAYAYGEFLAERFADFDNLIWVLGGDVEADAGGDFREVYREMARGLGARDRVASPEKTPSLMTYHPNGYPMVNSSAWFHGDDWLDFNMIETFSHRDKVAAAIRADLVLRPKKPTVLGEGAYEGALSKVLTTAAGVRHQAYHSFFAGAAGFTYGGSFGPEGNGPLFSPANNWKPLLQMEGAGQLRFLRRLLAEEGWPNWKPRPQIILQGRGEGEFEKLAAKTKRGYLIYFPDHSTAQLKLPRKGRVMWFNPQNGERHVVEQISPSATFTPPQEWEDAVLIFERGGALLSKRRACG